jgi:2-phospho-L-lactate guanylyltransferase (CobY/MobA/RfbA family)
MQHSIRPSLPDPLEEELRERVAIILADVPSPTPEDVERVTEEAYLRIRAAMVVPPRSPRPS